ncbi:hypothetical protein ACTXL6_20430 [Brachybacterium tyrofermentans]|uniref:hypothetical protein n=1 Tax=Brachybacterium tyrofermentans TaxID=47848 RepID=UPI003FD63F0B
MVLKVVTIGAIVLLLGLSLLRGRFGTRLLGVSRTVLNVIYLAALVLTGVLAGVFEQWVLLGVVVVLLVLSGIEEILRRSAPKNAPAERASTRRR